LHEGYITVTRLLMPNKKPPDEVTDVYLCCLYVRCNAFAATEHNVRQLVGFLLLLQQVNCVQRSVRRAHWPHQLFTQCLIIIIFSII